MQNRSTVDRTRTDCSHTSPAHSLGPLHPLGTKARVLLASVFGPYARDDEYGSRSLNPMELYHNQVTRVQGPFSLRMFHRSWGLMLIQNNISAPCTHLDFPTLDRFIQEITDNPYDVIGISSIMTNVVKVQKMCKLIRTHQPDATIVIGGHLTNMKGLEARLSADHIVRGEGVRWFRRFLGEREDQPIRHPRILSGIGTRAMGITVREKPGDVAAVLIPSVGCPMGCNFCATSAFFGGKGKSVDFYQTGDQLFEVMAGLERDMKVQSFFVMDENFLLQRKRALRLLELMQQHDKPWALYVFTSANVLKSYSIEQLVALGVSWVWMGLEGRNSKYAKLAGTDTMSLVKELQSHGIRVLGSTIVGMEEHTPGNIDEAIDYAVRHDTEFHQFMLYTPIPGTAFWEQLRGEGTLTDPDCQELANIHGQLRFNYRHAHIPPGEEGRYLLEAFTRDFEVNGPSVARVVRTTLRGYKRYRHCPDKRVRARFRFEAQGLATTSAGVLWASRKWFAKNPELRRRIDDVLGDVYRTFGWRARLAAPIVGRYIFGRLRREHVRLQEGWTYEPPTFCEKMNQPHTQTRPAAAKAPRGQWLPPVPATA